MRGLLALVLFAHCDRARALGYGGLSPSADGFRIAYFGYGSNLAASVREGRRGLKPLSCEVRLTHSHACRSHAHLALTPI